MFNSFKFVVNYIIFCSTLSASDTSLIPINTSYDHDVLHNKQEHNTAILLANLQQACDNSLNSANLQQISNKSLASIPNQCDYDLDDSFKNLSCQSIDKVEFFKNISNGSSDASKKLNDSNSTSKEDINIKKDSKIITLKINRIRVTKKILVPMKKFSNNNILTQNNKNNNVIKNNITINTNTNDKQINTIINNEKNNIININTNNKNIDIIQSNTKDKSSNKPKTKTKKSRLKNTKKLHNSFDKLQIVKNFIHVILGSKLTNNNKTK